MPSIALAPAPDNTAVGLHALISNNHGSNNTAMGSGALISNITGTDNTAATHSHGNFNTATGSLAHFSNNTELQYRDGPQAMYNNSSGTTTLRWARAGSLTTPPVM